MQLAIILLLLGCCAVLTKSRPPHLEETNDSETSQAEYEGNDDSAEDDYLREDQEPMVEEAQQRTERREDMQEESEEQGDAPNSDASSDQQPARNKYAYETLSDNNSVSRKERQRYGITDINTENDKDYMSDKERSQKSQKIAESENIAPDDLNGRSHINRLQKDEAINVKSEQTHPEYGDMLFRIKSAQTNRQNNNIAEAEETVGEQSRMIKEFYNNMRFKNRNQESDNNINYERNRRQSKSVEEQQSDSTRTTNPKEEADITNESSENAILRNIKKLSEQDLEELLNSLPDDKRALLKKIMDKREITKKAGAIDESSYLEGVQPDASKLEGGYSVDSNTESSMTTVTAETSKQPENSDNLSSKNPNESGSKGSDSKSEIINNTDMKSNEPTNSKESESTYVGSKGDVSIDTDNAGISKNEKREAGTNDLNIEKKSAEDSNISDYYDLSVNQEDLCSENEDWNDAKSNEPKENIARSETSKREINFQQQPSDKQDCLRSLEESFPPAHSYEGNNLESDMVPLIRVKRTGKVQHIKKRDSLISKVKVQYSPRIDSEECENEGKSEFDYGAFDHASNSIRSDQEAASGNNIVSANGSVQRRYSKFNRKDLELDPIMISESQQQDKMSIGSDTDSVLSGIEGVDDNLMYNSGSRGRRTLETSNDNADNVNLKRSGRTSGPINEALPDNSINVSHYHDEEAFGPIPSNSEEDVNRFKRVRQAKDFQKKINN